MHRKLIVLIIDNDDPTYTIHRNAWKAYMNSDPDILCFFLKQGNVAEVVCDSSQNLLVFPGTESLIPGVLEKTLKGFAYVLQHYTCDHILRTNISSFYVFSRLKAHVLPTLPRVGCYAGAQGFDGVPFASGAGMILSPDTAQLLVQNTVRINHLLIDDLAIATFLHNLRFRIAPLQRFDFVYDRDTHDDASKLVQADAQNTYHFRIKNIYNRARFDSHYIQLLLKVYYGRQVHEE
jgi:hypothetical protein